SSSSNILEIGSNDGYLLQHFVAKKIPCIGIDPAGKAAEAAKAKGVETVVSFFDEESSSKLIQERGTFDFINGINVFAHVPAIKTFIASLKNCLSENGVISLEFPHLAKLVEHSQFDTIYDEHFFYHSLVSLNKIFLQFDLKIFDLRELETHGGSLRIFISHLDNTKYSIEKSVVEVLNTELSMKLDQVGGFIGLKARSQQIKDDAVAYIKAQKKIGKKIAAFGAAAKGNVFLNYCGIGADSIDFVVDDTPAKQGKFLPGSHIPVVPATEIINKKPDIIVILPWNLSSEISKKLKSNEKWQGELVTFIPKLNII
ncbi:class I SAM-dependent methyltransferase, partial [Rhodospirillales bacterium]|nr:class I SAM-dependent methyltransferase [Rhodospirillales bacterium]